MQTCPISPNCLKNKTGTARLRNMERWRSLKIFSRRCVYAMRPCERGYGTNRCKTRSCSWTGVYLISFRSRLILKVTHDVPTTNFAQNKVCCFDMIALKQTSQVSGFMSSSFSNPFHSKLSRVNFPIFQFGYVYDGYVIPTVKKWMPDHDYPNKRICACVKCQRLHACLHTQLGMIYVVLIFLWNLSFFHWSLPRCLCHDQGMPPSPTIPPSPLLFSTLHTGNQLVELWTSIWFWKSNKRVAKHSTTGEGRDWRRRVCVLAKI